MRFAIVCVLIALLAVVHGEYPPNFPKCHFGDEACMVKGMKDIIQHFPTGQRDINLGPIDPFPIKSIHLERSPSDAISLDVKLSDIKLEGFSTMKVETFTPPKADLSGRISIGGTVSKLNIVGHYIIDGSAIILPVVGEGELVLACENLDFNFSFELKPVEKNGKIYAVVEHVKLILKPRHVSFNLSSLFNGDKTLTETTNTFLNANWKEVYAGLEKGISKAVGLVAKSYINKFWEHQPYADFFL